jgi:hypothetical protein
MGSWKYNAMAGAMMALVCHAANGAQSIQPSQAVLKALYGDDDCRYIGFAAGNHGSNTTLEELVKFLQATAKHDPAFKYVLVEGPSDFRDAFLAASLGAISRDEFDDRVDPAYQKALMANPQWAFVCTELLEAIQEINRARPDKPVLLIPIDSLDTKRHAADQRQLKARYPWPFSSSINRERETAKIVLDIVKKDSQARGAIFFHQGHLLKNLKRTGFNLDDESRFSGREMTHSNWVGAAGEAQPKFLKGLRVVLFNEADPTFNPDGTIDLEKLTWQRIGRLEGILMKNLPDQLNSPNEVFLETSYLRRIKPVIFPANSKDVVDAIVNCPPED